MSITIEKTKALPGVELVVKIAPLCAALKACASLIPYSRKAENIFVGLGMDSWAVVGFGYQEQYAAREGGALSVWIDSDPKKVMAFLSDWAKNDTATVKVTTGSVLKFETPDGATFTLIPLDELPETGPLDALDNTGAFTVGEDLADMIREAAKFVSQDAHRVVLTYVLVQPSPEGCNVVSTDTHCLYVGKSTHGIEGPFYIPAKAARLVSSGAGITQNGQTITMTLPVGRVIWQAATGNYPKWEKVIPEFDGGEWDMDICADDVIKATTRALVIAKDNAYRCRLTPTDGVLRITGRSEAVGECSIPCGLIVGKADSEAALNGTYLIKAMRTLGGTPNVKAITNNRPFVFENGAQKVVIMPMALV